MKIVQESLSIRHAVSADADLLCAWWNDGDVMAHAGFPYGLGTTPEQIRSQLAEDSDEGGRRLIIEIDGAPVGEMCYRRKSRDTAEIGVKICVADRREKGYGTACIRMLLTYLFDEMGYDCVMLDTNLENKRAQHVYEKIGFQKIAVNENAWQDQTGAWQTSVDYALKKEEYIK